jgi:hypothetical protein
MKVSIVFTQTIAEGDGVNSVMAHEENGVEDLYGLSAFITRAVNGAGFSYVQNVGFEDDDGNVIFGDS